MTSKDRMLTALAGGKPDRLPATVHQWQRYHLDTFMGGVSELQAFAATGLDAAVQHSQDMGNYWMAGTDFRAFSTPEWRDDAVEVDAGPDHRIVRHTITTPGGVLTYTAEGDRMTMWVTDFLIKRDDDIRLIEKYMPVPRLDVAATVRAYDAVGDGGILRGFVWGDQAGCWQHAALLIDTQDLILRTFDQPGWVHELLRILLEKKLRFIETMKGARFDIVETGGGAASSTLISPALHKEFCLPYDRRMHDALNTQGFKAVYHTCGGTRGIEEHIIANGCDASETLAPTSIGGNQEPWEFKAKIGRRLALIGGLDQFNVLTAGPAERIREKVFELFAKVGGDGGYIMSCCDHFFETPPENLRAYAEAARACVY